MSTENPPTAPGKALVKGLETSFVKVWGFFFDLKCTLKSQKETGSIPFVRPKPYSKKATIAWKTTRSSPAVTPETAGARPSAVHLTQTNLPSFLCFQTGSASLPPLPSPAQPRGPGEGATPAPSTGSSRSERAPPGQSGQGGPGRADNGARPTPPSPRRLRGAEVLTNRRWGEGRRAEGRGAPRPRAVAALRGGGVASLLCSAAAAAGPHRAARAGLGSSRTFLPRARRGPGMPPQHIGGGRGRLRPTRPGEPGRDRTPSAPARPEPPRQHRALAPLRPCPPRDPQTHRPLGPSGPRAPRRPGAVPAIGVHARERGRGGHGGAARPRKGWVQ